ncbi:LysR substrate-binding domain-containing protein [Pacificibacter maritimus]|uniref:LysR substrate-binding domain-containing protein n=1 Tax=Pacificibacter maritimus TaxID=762213 RepID=UPI001FEA9A7C|nr:LysR substrate-binding domain-containing protein [Pacificibacter maritimus]
MNDFQKSITLRHLRVISALADLKLVARVSEALNVTQPAVSKQIAELERIVGAPIVIRDRNRLFLTPIGERLAEHAKLTLNQIDRAAFDIEAAASGVSGAVSIGVVSSITTTLLPNTIALFKRNTPLATVSVVEGHFSELYPKLEDGTLDVLIARVWQPQELPGIDQMALFTEPVVVVAGRGHPLTQQAAFDWSDLTDVPWILPQTDSVARKAIDTLFAENGQRPPSNIIASGSLALNLELLRTMPALGFLPQGMAQTYATRGDVVPLPINTHGLLSEARCFWRVDQLASNRALSLFLKCVKQATDELKTIPFG